MKSLCKVMQMGSKSIGRRSTPRIGRRLMQVCGVAVGLVITVSASVGQVLVEPDNGWNMDDVRLRFGEPGTVRGPVGEPAVTRWDYIDFSVYFENQLVIIALGGDDSVDEEYLLDPEASTPETELSVSEVAQPPAPPEKEREDSPLVKAAGNFAFGSQPNSGEAKVVPVAYVPQPVQRKAVVKSMPDNGMSMSIVTDRFGRPVSVNAPIGSPPISVWRYEGFSVFFEHDVVLVSALEENGVRDARPGTVVDADAEPDADPTVDSGNQ